MTGSLFVGCKSLPNSTPGLEVTEIHIRYNMRAGEFRQITFLLMMIICLNVLLMLSFHRVFKISSGRSGVRIDMSMLLQVSGTVGHESGVSARITE